MKNVYSLKIALVALFVAFGISSKAQLHTLLGPRFIVNSPSAVAGLKSFRPSNQGAAYATTNWGRAIDSVWYNLPLVKASDSTGCAAGLSTMAGKFALIYRTTCNFSEKAYNAQVAGAMGVVIVNNVPGQIDFTMSPGISATLVTIPVIIIQKTDGDALASQLNWGNPVNVTLTMWGMNNTNDLAFATPVALPPFTAVPLTQMGSTNGNPTQYRFFNGALIANTGLSNETNVEIQETVNFTPTSGSPSLVYADTIGTPTFNTLDSILIMRSPGSHNVNTAVTGRYDLNYVLASATTDMFPADNTATASMYVTTGTFCNAGYDAVNDKPIVVGSTKFAAATVPAYTWGPLFYVAKGGYQALSAKLALNDNDTTAGHDLSAISDEMVVLFRWRDNVTANEVIEPNELTVVGIATVPFTTSDHNNSIVTSNKFINPVTSADVFLEDNTYYWVAAVTSNTYYIGVNNNTNYYMRARAAGAQTVSPSREYWEPQSDQGVDVSSYMLNATDSVIMYPFISKAAGYMPIDSIAVANADNVPAISFHIGTVYNTGINPVAEVKHQVSLSPNPASDYINVEFNYDKIVPTTNLFIMNVGGQIMYKESKTNIKSYKETISTKQLPAGNYYLITTEGSNSTLNKFTVVR